MTSGITVVDNSSYGQLTSASSLAKFRANLSIADLPPRASEVNLLEASSAKPDVRARLISVIRALAERDGLLPWPFKILQRIGQAITAGDAGFHLEASGKEWYLDDEKAIAEIENEATAFHRRMETSFNQLHDRARRGIQQNLKKSGKRYSKEAAREFLDDAWVPGEMIRIFAELTWKRLGLTGDAPFDTLMLNDAWRLLLDAEGLSVFYRAIAHQQPRRVQRTDLIQLVYLAGVDRRMIVTADEPFLRSSGNDSPWSVSECTSRSHFRVVGVGV